MIYEITVGIEQTFGCWYVYFHHRATGGRE